MIFCNILLVKKEKNRVKNYLSISFLRRQRENTINLGMHPMLSIIFFNKVNFLQKEIFFMRLILLYVCSAALHVSGHSNIKQFILNIVIFYYKYHLHHIRLLWFETRQKFNYFFKVTCMSIAIVFFKMYSQTSSKASPLSLYYHM